MIRKLVKKENNISVLRYTNTNNQIRVLTNTQNIWYHILNNGKMLVVYDNNAEKSILVINNGDVVYVDIDYILK